MRPKPATTTLKAHTVCIIGGDRELRAYAAGLARGLGLRVSCEKEYCMLIVLPGAKLEPIRYSQGRNLVYIACCNAILSVIMGSTALPKRLLVASQPSWFEHLLQLGYIPVGRPLVVDPPLVSVLDASHLHLALKHAHLAALCLCEGRCVPPYTRIKWR